MEILKVILKFELHVQNTIKMSQKFQIILNIFLYLPQRSAFEVEIVIRRRFRSSGFRIEIIDFGIGIRDLNLETFRYRDPEYQPLNMNMKGAPKLE